MKCKTKLFAEFPIELFQIASRVLFRQIHLLILSQYSLSPSMQKSLQSHMLSKSHKSHIQTQTQTLSHTLTCLRGHIKKIDVHTNVQP